LIARTTEIVAPAARYRKHLAEGRLTYQRCDECAQAVFYPRLACPYCGSTSMSWRDSAGRGVVYSLSVIPERDRPDRVVCLVDLDEGFRMMSTIVTDDPHSAAIGMAVLAVVRPLDGDDAAGSVTFVLNGG
jgi:uncharacterized protein